MLETNDNPTRVVYVTIVVSLREIEGLSRPKKLDRRTIENRYNFFLPKILQKITRVVCV